jgi:hypothetical protein
MRPEFEQLGFTDDSLRQALARIKAKHDKSAGQDNYKQLGPGVEIANFSAGPGSQRPSQQTIVRNRFILFVVREYEQQVGKRARISIHNGKKTGAFIKFLLAVAHELGIDSTKLPGRAQKLMEKNRLSSTIQ